MNKRALLGHLHRMGTASRADLAKSLGLSQPTAGKIVDELLEMGVFEEVEMVDSVRSETGRRSKAGRPARMLRLNRTKPRFLSIQLGIEETCLAAAPPGITGEDSWATRIETPDSAGEWLAALKKCAASIAQQRFWGVVVSVPGLLDERTSRILYSPNLHWTEGADLAALVRDVWKSPVVLVQEENALALGQQAADPEGEDFLLADFGDGVGSASVIDGKLHTHPLPISGEIGHTPVLKNDRRCGCGAIGCLETLVSNRGLLQSFIAANPKAGGSWSALEDSIVQRGVRPWLAAILDATAVVLAGALNVLGLRRIVITGTLNEFPPAVLEYLSKAISKGALWARFGEVKVEGAPRRRVAGMIAAGLDRLIMPMAESERESESLPQLSASHI